MNKKKLLQKIASAAVCATMLTGVMSVTACQTDNTPAGHQHNYTWVDDENGTTHHEHCGVEGCDAPDKASENHVDADNNNVCDKCNAALSGGEEDDDGQYDLVTTAVNFDEAAKDIDPSASGNFVLPEDYNYKNKVLFTATGKSRFEVGSNRFNTQGSAGTIIITLSGKTNSLTIAGKGASDNFTGYQLTSGGNTVKGESIDGQKDFSFELTDLPAGTYTLTTLGGAARINKIELTEKLAKSEATSISVTASKVDFLVNEDFSANGLSVVLNYANGRKDALAASDYEVTQTVDKTKAGKYTVTVKYKENTSFTDTYDVYYYTIDSISMHTIGYSGKIQLTLQQAAVTGGSLSNDYLTVKGTGTVGERTATFNLPASALNIDNVSVATAGEKTVNVSVKSDYTTGDAELSCNYKVMVKDAVTAVDNKVEITVGETGDFKTLTQAVQFLKACNLANGVNKIIKLQAGTYTEKVWIDLPNVTLVGLGNEKDDTVISYSLVEGDTDAISGLVWGLSCATLHVTGNNFKAYNLAIRNDFDYLNNSGNYSGSQAAQGLALTLEGDGNVIYNCHLFGNQDTLYMKNGRTYYYQTQIDGNIDFIFGGEKGLGFFEECKIVAIDRENSTKTEKEAQNGYVTAPQHKTATKPDYGYIFYQCELTDDGKVNAGSMALGRPWGDSATVSYIGCSFSAAYSKQANGASGYKTYRWCDMSNKAINADYSEYGSTGEGAITDAVTGGKVLTEAQAANYTKANIFGTSNGKSGYTTAFDCDTTYHNLRILAGLENGEIPEDPTQTIDLKDATLPNGNCGDTINERYADYLTWTGLCKFEANKPENGIQVDKTTVINISVVGEVSLVEGYQLPTSDYIITYKDGKATIKFVAVTGTYGDFIGSIVIDTSKTPEDTQTVNVTVDYNDGETPNGTIEAMVGSPLAKPADPVRDGYKFAGWKVNGADYNFTENVTEAFTLVAQWVVADSFDFTQQGTTTINLYEFTTGTLQGTNLTGSYRGITVEVSAGQKFDPQLGNQRVQVNATETAPVKLKFEVAAGTTVDKINISFTAINGAQYAPVVGTNCSISIEEADGKIYAVVAITANTYPTTMTVTISA